MTKELKYVMSMPLARPAELLADIEGLELQLILLKGVASNMDERGLINHLRGMNEREFATTYEAHRCVFGKSGECPVCVVHWQRVNCEVQQLPSDVTPPEADSILKELSCPECQAPVKVHELTVVRYCGRCDWSSLICQHVPKPIQVDMGEHGTDIYTVCAKCGADFLNGRWI